MTATTIIIPSLSLSHFGKIGFDTFQFRPKPHFVKLYPVRIASLDTPHHDDDLSHVACRNRITAQTLDSDISISQAEDVP